MYLFRIGSRTALLGGTRMYVPSWAELTAENWLDDKKRVVSRGVVVESVSDDFSTFEPQQWLMRVIDGGHYIITYCNEILMKCSRTRLMGARHLESMEPRHCSSLTVLSVSRD